MELSDFERDGDGFLLNPSDWSLEFARLAAEGEGVDYPDELNEVVEWARAFYEEYQIAPKIKDFSDAFYFPKYGKDGGRKAPVRYLAKLTNGSGMKRIDKIAGLPKPTGCV